MKQTTNTRHIFPLTALTALAFTANPAQAAIRVILRHPETVQHISQIPSHLGQLLMPDAAVLTQLLTTIQAMQVTLGRWPITSEVHIECAPWDAWPMLRQLAAMESLLPLGDHAQQLQAAIDKLLEHHLDERFNQLLHQVAQPNSDPTAKQQIKTLLKEKEELQKRLKSRQ